MTSGKEGKSALFEDKAALPDADQNEKDSLVRQNELLEVPLRVTCDRLVIAPAQIDPAPGSFLFSYKVSALNVHKPVL